MLRLEGLRFREDSSARVLLEVGVRACLEFLRFVRLVLGFEFGEADCLWCFISESFMLNFDSILEVLLCEIGLI
jgi:hypothetical protein